MDAVRGSLSATFHVEAPDQQEETRPEAQTTELETPVTRFRARVQLEPED